VSDLAKKWGRAWHGESKWPLILEVCSGYFASVPDSVFAAEVNKVHVPVEYGTSDGQRLSSACFAADFRAGLVDFLTDLPNLEKANARSTGLDKWLGDASNWANSGSSMQPVRFTYHASKSERKPRRSKWAFALGAPSDEVRRRVRGYQAADRVQKVRVIQKREAGKVRTVLNSDDLTYLRMAYISHRLETALQGNSRSFLCLDNDAINQEWQRMAEQCAGEGWNVPVDQTHYDWGASRQMLGIFFEVVDTVIRAHAPAHLTQDLLLCLQLLRDSICTLS